MRGLVEVPFCGYRMDYPHHTYLGKELIPTYVSRVLEPFSTRMKAVGGNAKVLDLCCGTGNEAQFLREQGFWVVGADLSHEALRAGSDQRVLSNADGLPFPNNSFDGIHFKDGYVHIENKGSFFSEMQRVLKPQGILLIVSDLKNLHPHFNLDSDAGTERIAFSTSSEYLRLSRYYIGNPSIVEVGPPYYPSTLSELLRIAKAYGFKRICSKENQWKPKKNEREKDWYESPHSRNVVYLQCNK